MSAVTSEIAYSRTVTLEVIHGGGQLRSYGDHIYEGYLTFTVPQEQLWASKYGEDEETARDYLKFMVVSFVDTDEPNDINNFYAAHLETLEQVSPGRWYYKITSPYID